jgi:predicted glutamine amidotransferase
MTKMTKYQLEHFESKVRRQFDPLISDQELLVKQYTTEATDKAVAKLSKKMGADKVISKFREAEKLLEEARATAKTFFQKKAENEEQLNRKFRKDYGRSYYDDKEITLSDCEEQLREWASNLANKEIERRPEGAKLKQLKDLKQKALDTVLESGTPEALAVSLDAVCKKIGTSWNKELTALPSPTKD